jgi:hypothetical protein
MQVLRTLNYGAQTQLRDGLIKKIDLPASGIEIVLRRNFRDIKSALLIDALRQLRAHPYRQV